MSFETLLLWRPLVVDTGMTAVTSLRIIVHFISNVNSKVFNMLPCE